MNLVATALRAVRTGRFERTLSVLTAAGAAITTAEIYLSHDAASFGNRMMYWPVFIVPTAVPAGVASFFSPAPRTPCFRRQRPDRRQRPAGDVSASAGSPAAPGRGDALQPGIRSSDVRSPVGVAGGWYGTAGRGAAS